MTQIVKTWKEKVALYFENRAKKDKKTDYDLAKDSILHLLHKELTTEESLILFTEIKKEFISKMRERSLEVKKENELLDNFLSVY
jgi:hypothetical protein